MLIYIYIRKLKIKKTQPSKKNDSTAMIMNSPLINGNANDINSPNNPDSPSLNSP